MIIDFKKKRFLNSSTILLDQIKIVSLIFLVLVLGSCFFLDRPVALWIATFSDPFKDLLSLLTRLFCPTFWILVSQAVFFYVRFVLRKEKKSRKLWFISLAIALSILAGKTLDLFFGRAGPEWPLLHGESPFRFLSQNCSFDSFPSVSSVTLAALATSLSCVFVPYRLHLLIGGFLLSFLPVLSNDHFLSDAFFGFYLGAIISQWIFQKMRREISF